MNFKTKTGSTKFNGIVEVPQSGFTVKKEDNNYLAVDKHGNVIGKIVSQVIVPKESKSKDAGKMFKLEDLVPAIDPASLVGKDPTTLTQEELIALTTYLTGLTTGKVKAAAAPVEEDEEEYEEEEEEVEEVTPAKTKKKPAASKPVVEEDDEEEDEDEDEEEAEYTYEQLEAMGVKALWKLAQPLGIDGINSRTKKGDMLEALAEYFNIDGPEDEEEDEEDDLQEDTIDEEEEEVESDSDEEEDEEDEDDEFDEGEDDEDDEEQEEYEEDDSDDSEEEEDEDDEEEYDEDEEEEDEEENEDGLTPADIDNLESKQEIVAIIKKYNIEIPKKKMNVLKVKAYIKQAIFGDKA